jgi:hypothetical protein
MVANVNIVHPCDDSHGELYFDDHEVCAEVSYIIDDTNGNQPHFEVARRLVQVSHALKFLEPLIDNHSKPIYHTDCRSSPLSVHEASQPRYSHR